MNARILCLIAVLFAGSGAYAQGAKEAVEDKPQFNFDKEIEKESGDVRGGHKAKSAETETPKSSFIPMGKVKVKIDKPMEAKKLDRSQGKPKKDTNGDQEK